MQAQIIPFQPRRRLRVGRTVVFKGYSDKSIAPIYHPGQTLVIVKVNDDEGMVTAPYPNVGNAKMDTVFPEEVELLP